MANMMKNEPKGYGTHATMSGNPKHPTAQVNMEAPKKAFQPPKPT
jgi:hypothetical protein